MGPLDRRYAEFLERIGFALIRPETHAKRRGRLVVERDAGPPLTVLELPGFPIDVANATFGAETASLYRTLRPLAGVPRMSTHAIAAIINRSVSRMAPGTSYVNVGVWNGYSLLSGMAANPHTTCIGIDNFSQFGGPREAFMEQFESHRGPNHHFHDMDYGRYFRHQHREPIGVYLYDGPHAYDHQLGGLQIAEPFFADDCVVIVDDTNWDEPRQATLDFVEQSERDYALLLDARTARNGHPTFWNGVMVFQATAASHADRGALQGHRETRWSGSKAIEPARVDRDSKVSLIVYAHQPDKGALGRTVDRALGQTWPNVEVLVADRGLLAAIEEAQGDFVAVVDTYSDLDEAAVHTGLALPRLVSFDQATPPDGGDGARSALLAADEIDAAIPPDEPYITLNGSHLAETIAAGPARMLAEPPDQGDAIDDAAAVVRLGELRRDGTHFVVFLFTAFQWLAERPGLESRLRAGGRCLVENERVLVFDLDLLGT